jgi:VWFA-related protein
LRKSILLLLFALIPISIVAAGRQSGSVGKSRGVIQVTTHLVQVNVIVKDRHGQLVPGLDQDDFTIFDDGKPQKISGFLVEQTHKPAALPPVPPDYFTNIPERMAGGSPAVTVVLLDGLNTSWADQAEARQHVIRFLRQIQPDDRVGLYTLGTRLVMLHDFTSDSTALVRSLSLYGSRLGNEAKASKADSSNNPQNTPEWVDAVNDLSSGLSSPAMISAIQEWLSDSTSAEARYFMNQRVAMTVKALEEIAEHLQGVPGRKNLIWVSSTFPLLKSMDDLERSVTSWGSVSYEREVMRAAQAVNDVNLAIYPVDARGLMTDPNFTVSGRPVTSGRFRQMQRPKMWTHPNDNFATMDEFAHRTGGQAFYNTNDIEGSIRQVIDDSRLSYLFSFYPSQTEWDGKFHKIKVKVDKPGLKLQYRDGYSAIPEPPPAQHEVRQALDAAVLSPLDATGVDVVVKATPVKSAGTAQNLTLQYWVDARTITLVPDGKKLGVRLTMVVEQLGPRGEALKGVSHGIDFDLDSANRDKFLASGVRFSEPIAIVPNAERLRFVVRDDPSDRMGSLSVPLDRITPPQPASHN